MGLKGVRRAARGAGNWVDTSIRGIRENGIDGLRDVGQDLYAGLWWMTWPLPIGTNVYERDWDVLIVLDACRVDLLRSVEDEYGFLRDIARIWSVGSMSKEWMAKTFTDEHSDCIENTAYVTANVFSERMLSPDLFYTVDEVWKYGWDEDYGTILPRAVTASAIRNARKHDADRLIVHYVQPHHPFLTLERGFDASPFGPDERDTVVDGLRKGKISRDRFWEAYRDNLRCVLDDVELLLSNLQAETVAITADHGDAFGAWGIYGHPVGFLHPDVRTVPWVTTTASDDETYEPTHRSDGKEDDTPVQQRLQALGYDR